MLKQQDLTESSIIIERKFSSVLKQIQEPQLKCKSNYVIQSICMNDKCKEPAFMCGNKNCDCHKKHLSCMRTLFEGMTSLVKKKEEFQKSFFEKIYETDNQMIEKVEDSNQVMAKQISLGSYEDKYMQVLNKIYINKEFANFFGPQMRELYGKLDEENKQNKEIEEGLQKTYATRALQLTEEGIKFKKEIFNSFLKNSLLKESTEYKPFINSALIRAFLTTQYANTVQCYKNKEKFGFCYFEHLDKDRQAFQKEYIQFLRTSLYNAKSAQVIFIASEHGFKAAQFHKKCDGVGQTLTVARTEYGKTIFAYAQQPWTNAGGAAVNDPTSRSCIILLDQKRKCPVVQPANSIYCHPSHGPTFGNGHDLRIYDSCHQNTNSQCAGFATVYNNGLSQSQPHQTMLCGNPSGNTFKVIEYQVFKLVF